MQWALVNAQDIVENVIVYDPELPYKPAEGLRIVEINDWVTIGDRFDMPQPTITDNMAARYTIEERRGFCAMAVAQKRDNVISSGITVNSNTYFTDDASLNTMLQAITMEGLGILSTFPRSWILADSSIITVSYDDIKAVAVAIAQKKNACYANYMALVAKIMASDAPELIDINTGWGN